MVYQRQFKDEVQRFLMKQRILRKEYDSQEETVKHFV